MKLSEAILLSIGVVQDNRSLFFTVTPEGPCGCAVGTALYSMGLRERLPGIYVNGGQYYEEVERLWPWTKEGRIATKISDRHVAGWSRERIAAWVATIESESVAVLSDPNQQEVCHAI